MPLRLGLGLGQGLSGLHLSSEEGEGWVMD